LWALVISNGLKWRESKNESADFLRSATLGDFQKPEAWSKLTTLVQIEPDDDLVPIRADYGGNQQSTIGLNILAAGNPPFWYTLPDIVGSKLQTGKFPKVLRAITFEPDGVQTDLRPVDICGNPEYRIDPCEDDFFRRLIDMRSAVKACMKAAIAEQLPKLDSTQLTLKILANSMSYGSAQKIEPAMVTLESHSPLSRIKSRSPADIFIP